MNNKMSLISLYHEHTRNQGYKRVYVSFAPYSEVKPDFVYSYILDNVPIDYYYIDYSKYDKETIEEELYDLLDDIDLMIILVDKEYLNRNEINEIEINTAESREMKVLPVLVDSKYIANFNLIFEHKQCIANTDDRDLFASKLEYTLRKYLFGNETYDRNKIAKLFKEPVFISYRKKDVSYVRDFISFLREDEELYPYQFWYDDFLNPGNNYDEEILEKLKASNIFILFITENIFEEHNYVKEIEYPYAIEHHKQIIAINAEGVSKKRIKQHFEEVDIIFDVGDTAIHNYLEKILPGNEIVGDENIYHLALAYYYGYIVEQNVSIAEKLFLQSHNYIPSKRYLADAYYRGDFGNYNIYLSCKYIEEVVNALMDGTYDGYYYLEGRKYVTYLMAAHLYDRAETQAIMNQAFSENTSILEDIELKLDVCEASLLNQSLEEDFKEGIKDGYQEILEHYNEEPDKYLLTFVRYSSICLKLYIADLDFEHDEIVEPLLKALNDPRNYDNDTLFNTVQAIINIAQYYLFIDSEKAHQYYSDALVYTLVTRGTPLPEYYCESVDKLGELGDKIYSDTHRNEIENRHFALQYADYDRNRYDYLYAHYLSKSNKAMDHILALYLYERYSLIDHKLFVIEKIDLYQKILNDLQDPAVFSEDIPDVISNHALEYLVYPKADTLAYRLYGRLVYLYSIFNGESEEYIQLLALFKAIAPDANDYIYDYVERENTSFFHDFDKERYSYPLDPSRDDELLNELYSDEDFSFDDEEDGGADA